MVLKLVLVSALVAVVLADQRPYTPPTPQSTYGPPQPSYGPPQPSYGAPAPSYGQQQQQMSPPKYQFDWAVNDQYSSNNYGHQEARDGYDTQGSYYVQLPDGRLQRVDYTVNGDSGFVAQVTYEGEAQYPQQQHGYGSAPTPAHSYGTPAPTYGAPTPPW